MKQSSCGCVWTQDVPTKFGVAEFCTSCDRCATACPAQAISYGPRGQQEHHNRSNLVGVKKWTTDAEKCFSYWTQSNAACSVCIRVCPYNRGDTWSDRLWRRVARVPALQQLALRWDDASGRGKRLRPASWWAGEGKKESGGH